MTFSVGASHPNNVKAEQIALLRLENVKDELMRLLAVYRLTRRSSLKFEVAASCTQAVRALDEVYVIQRRFSGMDRLVFSGSLLRITSSLKELIEEAERCCGGGK